MKALIVKRSPLTKESFDEGIPKLIKTHDLVKLSNTLNLPQNNDERIAELLSRLSIYATWAGRYPAPINYSFLGPQKLTENIVNTPYCWRGFDVKNIEKLITYFYSQLGRPFPPNRNALPKLEEIENWEKIVVQDKLFPTVIE